MTTAQRRARILLASSLTVSGIVAVAAWPSTVLAATQPGLGTAAGFAVIAGSTITSTGPTVINGRLALYPGTSVTGFPPGVSGTQQINNATALQAQADLATAYADAAAAPSTSDLTGKDLGGMHLTPGVYTFSSSAQLTGAVTFSGNGVFVIQVSSTLTTATSSRVVLTNGAQACAVYWQVGSSATLGTSTAFQGNLMAETSITMVTGAAIVTGRALAKTGALTMDSNSVTPPSGSCTVATTTPSASPSASPTTRVVNSASPTPPTPDTGSGIVAPGVSGAAVALVVGGIGSLGVVRRRSRLVP